MTRYKSSQKNHWRSSQDSVKAKRRRIVRRRRILRRRRPATLMEWIGLAALVVSAVLLMWPGGGNQLFRADSRADSRNDPLTAAASTLLAR